MLSSFAALLLVAPLALAPKPPADDPTPDAMDVWGDWVAARLLDGTGAYAPLAVAQGRVVLFASPARKAGKYARALEKTCAAFDELAPRAAGGAGAASPGRAVALFELDDAAALASLASFAESAHPHLAGWSASATHGVGFVLEEPFAAAWLCEVPGVEKGEWSPENELVNRLTRLLLAERHGRMPQWLTLGVAWYVELDVCRDIYCFPFRSGFVGKKEHKGFGKQLALALAARDDRPLSIDELAAWPRGTYDEDKAALAFGAATLLCKHSPGELPELLAAFARVRDSDGRITHPDGRWEAIAGYETPPAKQLAILNEVLGVDFERELERFGRTGARSYSRPR